MEGSTCYTSAKRAWFPVPLPCIRRRGCLVIAESLSEDEIVALKDLFNLIGWMCNGTGPVHVALLIMQLGFAGHQVLSRVVLTTGLNQFVYAIYRNVLALVIMSPFAYALERKERPPLTFKLISNFFLLGLLGIVGSQQLLLARLIYTSATFALWPQCRIPCP
ncbi:hypothetical protein R1sor_026288 [Riccia sorocarpa]|uniref:WAT1-related protein n=1 Tax=Riccia sorocarpa TaxID=122646 RepID=A0ABD3GE13_9MARC